LGTINFVRRAELVAELKAAGGDVVTLERGVTLVRHTHPGIESTYVPEGGGFDLPIEGQPTRTVRAGDAIQIPPGIPHGGGKTGDVRTRLLINYMEKGKPLVNPPKASISVALSLQSKNPVPGGKAQRLTSGFSRRCLSP
jgi:quercetin dioxygenase-like cupin family protein